MSGNALGLCCIIGVFVLLSAFCLIANGGL